ncbi:hypothetical protein [Rhizobium terrae]|uniref:hypothetical protein n=1 Tax=Rhizobium terrae TaxID=2171756 RepID=UPI00196762BB|nr:hypothetical protein [Rhizobium terrae]
MFTRSVKKIAGVVVAGTVMSGAIGLSNANAQATAPAAGCFVSPARMADAEIAAFLASPDGLLTQFSSGGLPLSNQARSLAGSSADTLAPLLALAGRGNAAQAAAIGAGLGRAARACAAINPQYASQIQDAVAASGNQALETAFLAGGNDTQTAALGGGALGGGGSATTGGGAAAIGGGGTPGGGTNGAAGGAASTGSGTSSFSAGGGGSYYASGDGGSTVIREVSRTTP